MDAKVNRRAVLCGAIGGGLLAALPATPADALTAGANGLGLGAFDPGAFDLDGLDGFGVDLLAAGAAEKLIVRMVHPRRQWHARAPKHHIEELKRRPDHIVIHHTATPNTKDLSLAHAYALSRQIQRFHMDTQGWNDIGEQLTISRGGHVMEGRWHSLPAILARRHVVGAQTLHHNTHTIGIENEGTYGKAKVPATLWSSLVQVCAGLCAVYGLDPHRAIVGHRDYNRTECPGNVLYARLPALRRAVAARVAALKAPQRHVNAG